MAVPRELGLRSEPVQLPVADIERRRLRTIVVDDSPAFLQIACELLALDPQIDLIARVDTGGEAILTVMKLKPDLILMDVNMPYLNGLTLAWFFADRAPSVRVVLMSADDTPELREACVSSGALAFVHKEHFRQEFGAVINQLYL